MSHLTVEGNAYVHGAITTDKGLDTANDAVIRQNLTVLGKTQTGPMVVAGTLTATGYTKATAAEIEATAKVGTDLTVGGDASVRGRIVHSGAAAPTVTNVSLKQADGSALPGGGATISGCDTGGFVSLYTFDSSAPFEMGSGSTVTFKYSAPLAADQTAVVTTSPCGGKWKNFRFNAVPAGRTGFVLQAVADSGTATLGGPGGDSLQLGFVTTIYSSA
jgi:hypothetical protein